MEEKVIKSFKGFGKDMKCRDQQYEEGKTYEMDGEVEICKRGFHACERPLDLFGYYAPGQSVYHEVEQSGKLSRNEDSDDTKVASSKIKIGARLDIAGIVKAHIEYVKAHTTMEHTDPKMATAGDSGAATAGNYGAATAGNYGAATSRGKSAVGKNGVALARGNNVRVKGGIGAILVLAEENESNYDIKEWKAFVIDGETYKPDTWYMLENGEIKEAE